MSITKSAVVYSLVYLLIAGPLLAQSSGKKQEGRYNPRRSNSRQSGSGRYQRSTTGKGKMRQLKQVWSENFLKGYKISGTFNRTDIRNVLRVFYEQTGLNFIINENIRGTVTGRFKDVPALEALITVLRVNDLYFIEEGSIIRIVPPEEYRQDIIKKNLITRVYDINYAQLKTLNEALEPILTEGVGKAVLDTKTNKLMVTDLQENFKEIENVIKEFSGPGKQVYIEIKVVSINLSDGHEHGVNWSIYNVGNYFSFSSLFNMSSGSEKYGQFQVSQATAPNGISGEGLLKLLNTYSDARVLTSPKIVAAHGEKAKIHIGDNIPYISKISQNQTTTVTESEVSFMEAGIQVEVTPEIGNDDTIRLSFSVEISSATSVDITDTQNAPQKTVTKAESIILCDNKALVVIGGLFEHSDEVTEQRIPLLGYIPLLKYLFSWKQTTKSKREIAILIQPHIIDSSSSKLKKSVKDVVDTENTKPEK